MASQLASLRKSLESYIKRVYRYQRTAATHVLVMIMISPEAINSTPQTLPVQCILYVELGDMEVRVITDKVIQEIESCLVNCNECKVRTLCNHRSIYRTLGFECVANRLRMALIALYILYFFPVIFFFCDLYQNAPRNRKNVAFETRYTIVPYFDCVLYQDYIYFCCTLIVQKKHAVCVHTLPCSFAAIALYKVLNLSVKSAQRDTRIYPRCSFLHSCLQYICCTFIWKSVVRVVVVFLVCFYVSLEVIDIHVYNCSQLCQ